MNTLNLLFLAVATFKCATALTPYLPKSLTESAQSTNNGASCDLNCFQQKVNTDNTTFLCGSDGFTYLNFEELNCVRKQCGTHITLRKYGRCPRISLASSQQPSFKILRTQNLLTALNQQNEFQEAPFINFPEPSSRRKPLQSSRKICLPAECNCPENSFQPICGSDKVTYGSMCLLDCKKECKPDLEKLHNGYCNKRTDDNGLCNYNSCCCPEVEYYNDGLRLLNPVCGSDGITYGSLCMLECSRNCKSDLQFVSTGYCQKLVYPETWKKL